MVIQKPEIVSCSLMAGRRGKKKQGMNQHLIEGFCNYIALFENVDIFCVEFSSFFMATPGEALAESGENTAFNILPWVSFERGD